MNRERFLDELQGVFRECHAISVLKNADYAEDSDPFKNFKTAELAHISLEKGIFVRMMDKMTRIGNLLDRPAQVLDESLVDTLLDLINYSAFIVIHRRHEAEMETYRIGYVPPMPPTP